MVPGVDDQNVAALDLDVVLFLPGLEMIRAVDIVVPNAELLQVHHAGRPNQLLNWNAGDIGTGIEEMKRRIQVRGDVVGGGDMLGVHTLEGDPLDPRDLRPLIVGKSEEHTSELQSPDHL